MRIFNHSINQSQVQLMEKQLVQCNDLIINKKKQLLLYYYDLDKKSNISYDLWNIGFKSFINAFQSSSNRIPNNKLQESKLWPWRNFYLINNVNNDYKSKKLLDEISSLMDFQKRLTYDLLQLQLMLKKVYFSNTLLGRLYDLIGHFFSLYCFWKLFFSLINVVFKRTGSVDVVTRLIEWFAPLFTSAIDLRFWTQQVFFIF